MSEEVDKAMKDMRAFMFVHVYQNKIAKSEESKAEELIATLYDYFYNHMDQLPEELLRLQDRSDTSKEQLICDHISAMSDRYAISLYEDLYIPKSWPVL